MRRVKLPSPPPSLSGVKAVRERETVAAFYARPENQTLRCPVAFRAYRASDVKAALLETFHGKCAYCESLIEATQPLDVEHFRPKGGVLIDGVLHPPGYHWLASRWENLLPTCIDCNRPRKQDFRGEMPSMAGKANNFPLASEERRAKVDGHEARERPLLLHPYFDDPSQHLEYVWEDNNPTRGEVVPRRNNGRASRRGKVSIDVYALQRIGLVRQRQKRLTLLLAHLEKLRQLRDDILDKGGDDELEERFGRMVAELEMFVGPAEPYSAMCQQVVASFAKIF